MTCEEFKAAIGTDPLSHTRAFRAAMFQHGHTCPGCRRIRDALIQAVDSGMLGSLSPEEDAVLDEACKGDRADPEYREVAFGEKPDDPR